MKEKFLPKLKEMFPISETLLLVIIVICAGILFNVAKKKNNSELEIKPNASAIVTSLKYIVSPRVVDSNFPTFYWVQYIDVNNDTTEFISTEPGKDCLDSIGKYPIYITVLK
jgi:hypothetical protein